MEMLCVLQSLLAVFHVYFLPREKMEKTVIEYRCQTFFQTPVS